MCCGNCRISTQSTKTEISSRPELSYGKNRRMDETITLDKQLEENIGPVILINKINLDPEDVNQFLKAWASDAEIMKQQPGFIQHNFIEVLLKAVHSLTMLYGNPRPSSNRL